MANKTIWTALIGWLAVAADGPAQDAYWIKPPKEAVKGEVGLYSRRYIKSSSSRTVKADGELFQNKRESVDEAWQFEWSILETDVKGPTLIRRRYEVARVITNGKREVLPYEGKSLLIAWKDGKYHFRLEGGPELSDRDARYLHEKFNDDRPGQVEYDEYANVLPRLPVGVGESWRFDMAPFLKALQANEEDLDAPRATGRGKLVGVYEREGQRFGVLRIDRMVPYKSLGPGAVERGCELTLDWDMDYCIDGSVLTGRSRRVTQRKGTVLVPMDGGKARMHIEDVTIVETLWKELKKK